jgi:WD40 repeat protein
LELAKISASAVDFDFLPYEPNLLVSGGEDCKLKVWKLPQKLTVEDTPKAPIFSLLAHEKRINILSVSKSVKGLVSTASFDQNLRVWDLERGTNVASFSWPNKDSTTSLEWRDDSSLLGTIKKDKQVRIFDFRTSNPEVFYHNGH